MVEKEYLSAYNLAESEAKWRWGLAERKAGRRAMVVPAGAGGRVEGNNASSNAMFQRTRQWVGVICVMVKSPLTQTPQTIFLSTSITSCINPFLWLSYNLIHELVFFQRCLDALVSILFPPNGK